MSQNNTTIRLELHEHDIKLLGTCRSKAFVRDQPCRFEPHGAGDHLSLAWEGGQMIWCTSATEALMIRAYEWANGFKAMLLWDLATAETTSYPPDAWVVLSDRPWPA